MNTYELTLMVEDAKALKSVEKALDSFSGKKIKENAWGKRLLAYPINKITGAEYYTWHIQIETDQLKEFKKILNYDKLVMRYLLLGYEEKVKVKPVAEVKQKEEKPKKEKKS